MPGHSPQRGPRSRGSSHLRADAGTDRDLTSKPSPRNFQVIFLIN